MERKRLRHKDRMGIMRDIHKLQSGLVLLKRHFNHLASVRIRRAAHNMGLDASITDNAIFVDNHMPFIRDFQNSIDFVLQTLNAYDEALSEIRSTLITVGDARTTQINTALSMVATVFLPLSFLTGVFGMNFDGGTDGKYPIGLELLNDPYGALIFWAITFGFIVSIAVVFRILGWTDIMVQDPLAWA